MHGSTIVSGGDEDEKMTMRIWFQNALARTRHFDLAKPEADARQATAPRRFSEYTGSIETSLGVKVWDIQRTTISVVLQDSNGLQKELSGRADYIISSTAAKIQGAAYQHALCVVEIQSKSNEEDCEYELVTYLVLLMNRYGLSHVAGILVYIDGTCRAYRASRSGGDAIYEQNDKFHLYQITDILGTLLTIEPARF